MMNEFTNDNDTDNDILVNLFQIVATLSEKINVLEEEIKIYIEDQGLMIKDHFEEFSKTKKEEDLQEIKNMIQEEFKTLKKNLKHVLSKVEGAQQKKNEEKESPEDTMINVETLEL